MMIGVGVDSVSLSTVGVETVTVGSEEHALNRTRTARAIPSRNVLVVVAGVVVFRVIVP
jgi:hypothetical protein